LSIVKFLIVSVILSILFSAVKIFRYGVNSFDVDQEYPIPYDRNFNNLFSDGFSTNARVINVFNAISDLINNLVFIIVNLIFDIILVIKLKKTLEGKIYSNKKVNEIVIFKTIVSVVSLALFSIALKLPASAQSIFYSVHLDMNYLKTFTSKHIDYLYEFFCVYGRLCPMLEKLTGLLYILSISASILFHYVFDKRFKMGLKVAISKMFSSKRTHLEYLKVLEESRDRMYKSKL